MSTPTCPATLTLKWCDKCGRTDQYAPLKERHFSCGHLCEGGTVHTQIYIPKDGAER